MKKAIFTICAKNYLAQAIALRESTLKHNDDVEFFLFLSDLADSDQIPDYVVRLDNQWIKGWRKMAFKYNVIEFSTSIKPFCFNKLFNDGFDEVMYLDPDIYVTSNLSPIFGMLKEKSIVLTPHYCNIQENYTGSVSEEELLFVGIYNLGFCAIKKNTVGEKIVQWWMNRLENKCYADHHDALHVDQRWMDFIPGFFPNDTCITHHMGINPAIWNLHERELMIDERGKYQIRNSETNEIFPLLFFHFSGFDPFNPSLVNRRHPKYGIDKFPSFEQLINEYVVAEYDNGYDIYTKLEYAFNAFEDGENIMPIHRRIYRSMETDVKDDNPFSIESQMYKVLQRNKLLSGVKTKAFKVITKDEAAKKGRFVKVLKAMLKCMKITLGVRYYSSLLLHLAMLSRFENQEFLIKKDKSI